MNINEKLKNRRKELSLTMLEVAQKVGVSEATVSRWESGDIANMRRDKIVLLAKALRVSPAYIMGWTDEEICSAAETKNQPIVTIPFIDMYNSLNALGKEKAQEYITDLSEQPKYTSADEERSNE